MKQIITIALLILLPISIYSQNMEKIYRDGIDGHLEKGDCEDAERVYRAATKNKVIEVDKDIESRIAECKSAAKVSQAPQQTPSSPKMSEPKATRGTINGHEYVDLGLSVKWATCNVGANSPEEYGYYFAWGETEPKTTYNWDTYKYCNGDVYSMTKYCEDSDYGIVDNKTTLELKDDAAYVNWEGKWRMPTAGEIAELIDKNNCTWEWTTQNGVNGYKVTSKKNGNSIFLPAASYRGYDSLANAGYRGNFWSSSLGKISSGSNRYNGLSVRPVCE